MDKDKNLKMVEYTIHGCIEIEADTQEKANIKAADMVDGDLLTESLTYMFKIRQGEDKQG